MKISFILLFLINFCFSLIPTWNFDKNAVPFFSSAQPNYREIEAYKDSKYQLLNTYTKNGDGTITVQHKLSITKNSNTDVKIVQFGSMEVFYDVADFGQIICPRGKFHPHDSDGNEISISISSPEKDWYLKCVKHGTGVFLAFYLDKDSHALYGYLGNYHKPIWDEENEFQQILYNLKIKDNMLDNNNLYPIVFIAKDGDYIKLIGAKQALKSDENIHRANVETKDLVRIKSHTITYFSDSDDKYYLITYDKNSYSIVYSLKSNIGNYANNDDIKNVGETKITDLTLPYSDKIEILSMNFIKKTTYVYYSVKNLETDKVNYGIMELLSQQVIFNTDQEITNFEPLSNHEMLVFAKGNAFKKCLFRNGDTCEPSCPSGTNLVLDVNGNKCKSSDTDCSLKLEPDNICIDSCNTEIYKLSDDSKSCKLCKDIDSSKPYRLIKTDECLESKPEGTQDYIAKYYLLECAKGYQFNSDKKRCVPHCYPSCLKCNDYSEDSTNHECISCKEGYNLNGTNCEEIVTDVPSTILEIPPTTIINIPPTTILNIPPTTIINFAPTTIIKDIPTPIEQNSPSTIINPATKNEPSTIQIPVETTIITPKSSLTPTTIIIPPPNPIISPTISPQTVSSTSPNFLQQTNTPTETMQSNITQDKCLSGLTLNENCKNITDNKINTKLKEEILSSYAENAQMKVFKGEKYSAQVSNSSSEMNSFNPENDIPIIDLGYCETILKQANGIPLDQSLIIIKLKIQKKMKIAI